MTKSQAETFVEQIQHRGRSAFVVELVKRNLNGFAVELPATSDAPLRHLTGIEETIRFVEELPIPAESPKVTSPAALEVLDGGEAS